MRRHHPPSTTSLATCWLLALGFLLAAGASCTFEGDTLEDRRCINNEACWESLGMDWFCRQQSGSQGGYCQQLGPRTCNRVEEGEVGGDAACDDQIYCNGDDVCNPEDPTADDFGCVHVPRVLSDNIECTLDYCDEENDTILHDPIAMCECTGPGDRRCETLYQGPCVDSTACNPSTFLCEVTYKDTGEPCDDGVACTTGSTCTVDRECLGGAPDHTACDDNKVCTGVEQCSPTDDEADSRGCVPGQPVITDPDQDDGVACTRTSCDDASPNPISHLPTAACQCQSPQDCRDANPAMSCLAFRCDASNGFTCAEDPEGEALSDGSSCDDGFACTANDSCDSGACIGTPTHPFCDPNGNALCDPGNPNADANGCVPTGR